MNKRICVIGGGYWGKNHIKTLFAMNALGAVVDSSETCLNTISAQYRIKTFSNIDDTFQTQFDGYVIATPAETHYAIAKKLLTHKCNVLIEKPFTLSSDDSQELIDLAQKNDVNLMVGHLMLFHPAITKIKTVMESGRIGEIRYLYSNRLSFGIVRTNENILWSFAPHDISIMNFLAGSSCETEQITARGTKILQSNIDDTVVAHLVYPGNIHAHFFVSWLHPFKEHRLVVIGSKGMIVYEDSSAQKDILLYNRYFNMQDGFPMKNDAPDEIIDYDRSMPLENELKYFIQTLDDHAKIADGISGHGVVTTLEKIQSLLD